MSSGGSGQLIATLMGSVFSSGALVAIIQVFLSRRTRKQQAAKDDHALLAAKREARDADEERAELLAEAQATAQRTALESAAERFGALHKDYKDCMDGLREVRSVAFLLVDAMSMFVSRLQPNGDDYTAILKAGEVEKARFAIEQARQRLYG